MPLYSLTGASRRFSGTEGDGIIALDGVTLQVARGERIALIGPSGAGKTTLFRLLNGTLRSTAGRVCFDGVCMEDRNEAALRAMRRRIGTVYQAQHLVPQLPVYQNVLAGRLGAWSAWRALVSRLWPSRADLDRVRTCLDLVGLAEKWSAPTHTLSGGQRQRVAIARVLMQDPPVILADEPVSALDPTLAQDVLELLLGLHGADRTLVASLHTVDLALEHFPRIVALKEGKIFFDLPARSVTGTLLDDLFRHAGPHGAARPADGRWGEGERASGTRPRPALGAAEPRAPGNGPGGMCKPTL